MEAKSQRGQNLQRKKRLILDRKADLERVKNNNAKISIEGDWICVDGVWTGWLDREARWITEKEWDLREKEERKKLEAKLTIPNRELGSEERDECTTEVRESQRLTDETDGADGDANIRDEEDNPSTAKQSRCVRGASGKEERNEAG